MIVMSEKERKAITKLKSEIDTYNLITSITEVPCWSTDIIP